MVDRIRNQAYYQRYSGGWQQVQDFLEQVNNLRQFEEWYSRWMSDEDFFGNFLPDCERILRRESERFLEENRHSRKPPKRKVYRRGYLDKGSLRPYHQRGRSLPDPNPGEDRRDKVKYSDPP